jgi:D-tyrosyl-tRNA(Tyr) deacylase
MRAVVQRVSRASVSVEGKLISAIGEGLMVLLGVENGDTEKDARYIADKVTGLRIFEDAQDKMNLSVSDKSGEILMVSQFTLCGDCRHGRRPSFTDAMEPAAAKALYEKTMDMCRENGVPTKPGQFQAHMEVALVNDGPVTIILDSRKRI